MNSSLACTKVRFPKGGNETREATSGRLRIHGKLHGPDGVDDPEFHSDPLWRGVPSKFGQVFRLEAVPLVFLQSLHQAPETAANVVKILRCLLT